MSNLSHTEQSILTGSRLLSKPSTTPLSTRETVALHAIKSNKAFQYYLDLHKGDHTLALADISNRFVEYRSGWQSLPDQSIRSQTADLSYPPLCIDLEVASICDLACPFCYRSTFATPDKLISDNLAYSIIDQAAQISAPSMKFNWRGEPLMHPRLENYISYAKSKGIIDTIINTNATHLTRSRSKELINSGLDFLIYSFDGATKSTYEKNRPGRFRENQFEAVVKNIKDFSSVRDELGSVFPRTKIQMILSADTYGQQDEFFDLFKDIVDEVSVTQYSERGGHLDDLPEPDRERLLSLLAERGLPASTPYMKTPEGKFLFSTSRIACKQPFQRLMVTYDGRTAMCCYDWGAKHTISLVSHLISDPNYDKHKPISQALTNSPSYDHIKNIQLPPQHTPLPSSISSLSDSWNNDVIVSARKAHINNNSNSLDVCRNCSFKDTYEWEALE